MLCDLIDHGRDLVRLRHVVRIIGAFHLELALDRRPLFLDVGGLPEAVDDDVGAILRQRASVGEADAAGGPRHDGVSIGERHGLDSLRMLQRKIVRGRRKSDGSFPAGQTL